jgi:hypothetical protein
VVGFIRTDPPFFPFPILSASRVRRIKAATSAAMLVGRRQVLSVTFLTFSTFQTKSASAPSVDFESLCALNINLCDEKSVERRCFVS